MKISKKKKPFKLSVFKRFLYRHFFYSQYKSLNKFYTPELYWNIITWVEFFKKKYSRKYKVSFMFCLIDNYVAKLTISNRQNEIILDVNFLVFELSYIQDESLNMYYQINYEVYEVYNKTTDIH